MSERRVVGLEPWLPWPLSAWEWWSRPVRAERLAVLRIGLAAFLLIDILTSYRPHLHAFFGSEGLGGARMFAYYGEAPKLNWSILRGVGDPLLGALALITWVLLAAWLPVDAWTRRGTNAGLASVWALMAAGVLVVLGAWARGIKEAENEALAWALPLGMAAIALVHVVVEYCTRGAGKRCALLLANLLVLVALAGVGMVLPFQTWAAEKTPTLGHRLLLAWQDDAVLLTLAFWAWALSTALLMIGLATRWAAIASWALTLSFASANPNIDNAGDTIRGIALFYLMLCPAGAVWSVDRWLRRRRETSEDVYVWPWALRLLFVQLVFIYFVNGLYKVTGREWVEGDSLHYVLCDLTLTRFSIVELPVPLLVTRISTWMVLVWELAFPVLVLFRRTRGVALVFGVAFHLGILATMELGGFVPYVLCLYLPLLPWKDDGPLAA
jgi:hypothetical protein